MKWLKRIGLIILILIAFIAVLFFVYNESKPQGQKGPEADALAKQMLDAIDKTGWDTTAYIQWTFKGMHSFLWDKNRHFVKVTWEAHEVLLDTKKVDGLAFLNGIKQTGEDADKMIQDAWTYFCNDSFWLNAPSKAFDIGTERSIVDLGNSKKGLMVSYTSGGVTPGDSYLWILNEQNLPISWKMWVSIIPLGGMEFSWDKWTSLSTGAKISTFHTSSLLDLDISNLKGASNLAGMGLDKDPFEALK